MSGATFDYQLFGLKVRSAIELPELRPSRWIGPADVTVYAASLDRPDAPSGVTPEGEGMLVRVDGVAKYLVTGGDRIVVDAAAGIDPRNVRLFLLGSAFGMLLHQRGLFPLHANAVDIDGTAFAFMGPSGAGKSTLAAWFHDHGHRVLSDDVCVIDFDDERGALASFGIPRLRLWLDALERSGRQADELKRSYIEREGQYDKFDLPIDPPADGGNVVLSALYCLDRGEAFAITPLSGVAAVNALFENTYRGGWVAEAGSPSDHWHSAVRLARTTPVFQVTRPWDPSAIDDQARALLDHARSLGRA